MIRADEQHRAFYHTFWSVAPKNVRYDFLDLQEEIKKVIKNEEMPSKKIPGYAYNRLSKILDLTG